VFKLNKARKETVLHSFNGVGDGGYPYSDLIRDSDGNLYGTTYCGGKTEVCPQGHGTVFKLDKKGRFAVLYSFAGGKDGSQPTAGLYRDAAGNLYGTTTNGGDASQSGTVFMLDTTGKETVLYRFSNGADGGIPWAGVIQDAAGNLYGTTTTGGVGACDGRTCGVVFKLDPKGNEIVLHAFTGNPDGADPRAALIQDAAGNLFGTTHGGGINGGTVFKIDANGIESVLRALGDRDGAFPWGHLVQDSVGNLYGTTTDGGMGSCGGGGCGTVFKITP